MQPTENDFKLAQIFLKHSLNLKPKEKLLITAADPLASPLTKAVYIEALKMGVFPLIDTQMDFAINRAFAGGFAYQFYRHANDWQLNYVPEEILASHVNWADAYVRIVTIDNPKELQEISTDKIMLRNKLSRPYFDKMADSDRWILTYYPTQGMALNAGMSFDSLVEFYYRACIVDYDKMKKELTKIEKVLDCGEKVRIVGEKTDLTFSIKGRLAKASYGERNIPDGEVFLAPVHETIEGTVFFDFPSENYGQEVQDVTLEFKNGRVVKAEARVGQKTLDKALDSDAGARSFGELGIGTNYEITKPMKATIFDEKIGGTIHLALGRSYKEERGGAPVGFNESVIHWDLVKNMHKKGSVLYIDNKPLLKEGKFSAMMA